MVRISSIDMGVYIVQEDDGTYTAVAKKGNMRKTGLFYDDLSAVMEELIKHQYGVDVDDKWIEEGYDGYLLVRGEFGSGYIPVKLTGMNVDHKGTRTVTTNCGLTFSSTGVDAYMIKYFVTEQFLTVTVYLVEEARTSLPEITAEELTRGYRTLYMPSADGHVLYGKLLTAIAQKAINKGRERSY